MISCSSNSVQNKIDATNKSTATKGLATDEMISQTYIFFVAGYETTATSVAATVWLLLKNPHYVQKIRDEANKIDIVDCNSPSENR